MTLTFFFFVLKTRQCSWLYGNTGEHIDISIDVNDIVCVVARLPILTGAFSCFFFGISYR